MASFSCTMTQSSISNSTKLACSDCSIASSSFNGNKLYVSFASPKNSFPSSHRLVVQAKGKKNVLPGNSGRQAQGPMLPSFDPADDTPKFVLFISSKAVDLWYPLSVVSGGTAAKMMVSVMESEFGRKLYQGTLTRNIGSVIYQDEKNVRDLALKQYPVLKTASKLEYGYKLMDKDNVRASMLGSNVIRIPPAKELRTVLDKAKDFFNDKIKNFNGQIKNVGLAESEK